MSTMNLHVLFIQRAEAYDGQYAPELLLAWDEYSVDNAPDQFESDCKIEIENAGDDVIASDVVLIAVDADRIRKRLLGKLQLKGEIVE